MGDRVECGGRDGVSNPARVVSCLRVWGQRSEDVLCCVDDEGREEGRGMGDGMSSRGGQSSFELKPTAVREFQAKRQARPVM